MSTFCNVMLLLLYVHVCVTRTVWKTRPRPKTVILLIKQSINQSLSHTPPSLSLSLSLSPLSLSPSLSLSPPLSLSHSLSLCSPCLPSLPLSLSSLSLPPPPSLSVRIWLSICTFVNLPFLLLFVDVCSLSSSCLCVCICLCVFADLPVCFTHRLVGLVVKASASRAEGPGFESRLRRDFSWSSPTIDLKIGTPVATLPGAWRYRVSTGTGRPGVSIL